MVQLMISKGADQWNWGLWEAYCEAHMNMVQLMVEKGVKNIALKHI